MNEDERLKATFAKLRAHDARRAPSFDAILTRRRARVSPWAIALPAISTLAAAALFLLRCGSAADPPTARPVAMAQPAPVVRSKVDDAPLDFLLDLPGLRGTPNFDTSSLRGSLR